MVKENVLLRRTNIKKRQYGYWTEGPEYRTNPAMNAYFSPEGFTDPC